MDVGILRGFREDRGRQLAAGIAVDTGPIDEKLALDTLRHFFPEIGHRASRLNLSNQTLLRSVPEPSGILPQMSQPNAMAASDQTNTWAQAPDLFWGAAAV
jgi:hypothetical protein